MTDFPNEMNVFCSHQNGRTFYHASTEEVGEVIYHHDEKMKAALLRIDRLENVNKCAKVVMELLEQHGANILPYLIDTDENAGQRLREALSDAEVRG